MVHICLINIHAAYVRIFLKFVLNFISFFLLLPFVNRILKIENGSYIFLDIGVNIFYPQE